MFKKIPLFIIVLGFSILLFSCKGSYQRLLKSSDYELKYKRAIEYYEKKDYTRALPLLEELVTVMRGTARAEKIHYYFAQTNYAIEDYLLASYHFKDFARTYPQSQWVEEATYLSAYCFYLTSPPYSLDQSNTISAIQEMQVFINLYPQSTHLQECNQIIDKLRLKLENKAFDISKLYYNTANYQAAIVAFNNFQKDFPDSKYREEASYLQLKSAHLLAINSIETKMPERLKNTQDLCQKYLDTFPKGRYHSATESIFEASKRMSTKSKKQSSIN
ncbi:MAG TPA: outer membrane protein assembly factor BamD [Bacteroidia bacterium]|nr:outer membrane protein assembly factor BamD [Bacteroidia bacterium]